MIVVTVRPAYRDVKVLAGKADFEALVRQRAAETWLVRGTVEMVSERLIKSHLMTDGDG